MKKLTSLLFLMMVSCLTVFAQNADYQKTVAKYKNAAGITAAATRTKHSAAVKNNASSKGTFYMKKPNKVSIIIDGGKDKLIMNGTTFTMVIKGKKHVTDSKKNAQFATFQTVFQSILSGGQNGVDISKLSDVKLSKSGQNLTITITPDSKKKMMFSSFVLVLDTKTSEIKSLRMNEKGKNYTEYTFSGFNFNAKFNDNVFVP